MSKYLNEEDSKILYEYAKKILDIRNQALLELDIDLNDTDNLSSALLYPIKKELGKDFNINFARNGEDAENYIDGKKFLIEIKTSKVVEKNGKKKATSFAFHAKGLINHDQYLFCVRDKHTLELKRFYYVKTQEKVQIINDELKILSDEWHKKPSTKGGYDIIRIKEKLLEQLLDNSSLSITNFEGIVI